MILLTRGIKLNSEIPQSNVLFTSTCSVNGGNKKLLTNCEICSKHYFDGYLYLDLHHLENFEIKSNLK